MTLIVMFPIVVVVGIGAVLGIRTFYNHTQGKKNNESPIEEFAKNVEAHTKNLANSAK